MSARGTFIAVVGPSGSGKDTLMSAVAARRPDIAVARRTISRAPSDGTEVFESVGAGRFDAMEAAGAFVLSWRAHGLGYGIPADVGEALAAGRHVLANLSRTVLPVARELLQPMLVIAVTAPRDVLATRLAARGREAADDIAQRLARAGDPVPPGVDVTVIDNGGDLEAAIAAMLAALPQPVSASR